MAAPSYTCQFQMVFFYIVTNSSAPHALIVITNVLISANGTWNIAEYKLIYVSYICVLDAIKRREISQRSFRYIGFIGPFNKSTIT